jgi:hypothetical protein
MVCHAVFLAELDFCGLILMSLFVAEHSTVIQKQPRTQALSTTRLEARSGKSLGTRLIQK